MENTVKFWQSNLHGCRQSNSAPPLPQQNNPTFNYQTSDEMREMCGPLIRPGRKGERAREREMNGSAGVPEQGRRLNEWMNEWDSNERRGRWRGGGTEGNRTFRVVGLAVKRIGKEDKMNTAASQGEGCTCNCVCRVHRGTDGFWRILKSFSFQNNPPTVT